MEQTSRLKLAPALWNRASVVGRAALFVPTAMAVWWFLLKVPSLWLLRALMWLPLALFVAPAGHVPLTRNPDTGEWVFSVQVHTSARDPQTGQSRFVDSLDVTVPADGIAEYAAGWFCYLALALSTAPFSRRAAKRVLLGLGVQAAVNVASLAACVWIMGYGSVVNAPGDPRLWLTKYFDHINSLVLPFLSPFLVALIVHPEWREWVGISRPDQAPRHPTTGPRRAERRRPTPAKTA